MPEALGVEAMKPADASAEVKKVPDATENDIVVIPGTGGTADDLVSVANMQAPPTIETAIPLQEEPAAIQKKEPLILDGAKPDASTEKEKTKYVKFPF